MRAGEMVKSYKTWTRSRDSATISRPFPKWPYLCAKLKGLSGVSKFLRGTGIISVLVLRLFVDLLFLLSSIINNNNNKIKFNEKYEVGFIISKNPL